MDKNARLFTGEFITGGGLATGQPPELAHEGDLMLQTLLHDLLDAGYEQIVCPRDPKLPELAENIEIFNPGQDVLQSWQRHIQSCDAAWIIAPESGGILQQLTALAEACQCRVIGCDSRAIELTASKSKTSTHLMQQGIPVISCSHSTVDLAENPAGWVIKPEDGVGGEGCYRFTDLAALKAHIERVQPHNIVIQEYLPGIPASLTLLCCQGEALMLGCNEQLFSFDSTTAEMKGRMHGVVVNGLRQYQQECAVLASAVVRALDGVAGIIGIDLIMTAHGPVVVEVNPRLTTAYAGLHESLGINPAALVMQTLKSGSLPELGEVNYRPVTIRY